MVERARIRTFALLISVGVAPSSWASFDLLLQTDFEANQGHHIDRYDPVSKVYLGSFEIGPSAPTAIAASAATGHVYVALGGSLEVYNYSTGAYVRRLGTATYRDIAVSADGTHLYVASQAAIRRINTSNGLVTNVITTGLGSADAVAIKPSGGLIVADTVSLTWRSFNASFVQDGTYGYQGLVTSIKQIAYRPNDLNAASQSYAGATNLNANLYGVSDFSPGLGSFVTNVNSLSAISGVVSAHQGMYAIGTAFGSSTQLRAVTLGATGSYSSSMILSQTTSLSGRSAIVLAPEPGTVIALAAGSLALLRRRSTRR